MRNGFQKISREGAKGRIVATHLETTYTDSGSQETRRAAQLVYRKSTKRSIEARQSKRSEAKGRVGQGRKE